MIYGSDVDWLSIAEVPELPGCSVHGNSSAEALEQVDKVIELWIETARGFGDPVPEPKGCKRMKSLKHSKELN